MTSVQELKNRTAHLPPADDNVKLPAAIRAAAARSQSLHDEAYNEPQAEGTGNKDGGNGSTEGEQAQAKSEAERAPEAGMQNGQTPPKEDDFEHKYNSLKGRYDRDQDTIRGLTGRISQMEALLARTSEQAPKPVAQLPNADLQFKAISKEDRDAYGEDFLDVAARAAQERLVPELTELRRELASLKGTVGSVAQKSEQSGKQQVYDYLTGNLANWRELNRDPKFLAWINLQDPLSGDIRIHMMTRAFEQNDAARVLRFFQGFLADEAATAPAETTKPASNKVPLETFAAPGRAKAPAASSAPGEKETISQAQIAAFYLNVQKGHYKGNDAEKNRLEQMIFDAQREGRVTP